MPISCIGHCLTCLQTSSDMPHMTGRQASFFTALFLISQMFRDIVGQQCRAGGDLYSIYQMMLKDHTFKTFKFPPGTLECREACLVDDRCQSYNVVMFIAICELNNRTKEARPKDFVKDENRYYMPIGRKRGERTKRRRNDEEEERGGGLRRRKEEEEWRGGGFRRENEEEEERGGGMKRRNEGEEEE
ncbi:hypothetical protein AWC38_SpisGene21047 [Stylophora pistillata]|uniref:Apple domain-containing protein n=1 Tax=Stylophora pistillata TaxID=50429 RepID=A0A2B4R8V2_STYPI|nr:hypothetical protein AWC38_SpisGene21047 [Stylophora pistillata]